MIDEEIMVKRAMEDCDEHLARYIVGTMVDNWVPELEQNIWEWVEHKPFTEIKVGELSLNFVITLWGGNLTISNMGRAMKEFRDYVDRGFKNPELFIKRFHMYG